MAINNDFTRDLTILKPVRQGDESKSGFVRAEQSRGHGRITLNVQGFDQQVKGRYYCLLIGRETEDIFAHSIGAVNLDMRGQGTVSYEFDAARIGGREYGSYLGYAVCELTGDTAAFVLLGFRGEKFDVNGHDAISAISLAMGLSGAKSEDGNKSSTGHDKVPVSASPQPSKGETAPVESDAAAVAGAKAVSRPMKETPDAEQGDFAQFEIMPMKAGEVALEQLSGSKPTEEKGELSAETGRENDEKPPAADAKDDGAQAAKSELGVVWRGYCQELLDVFLKHERVYPYEKAKNTMFVKVTQPVSLAGIDHYLVGAHVENGEVSKIAYCVPGSLRPSPPPGLEGYKWKQFDGGNGYWVMWHDGQNGYPSGGAW